MSARNDASRRYIVGVSGGIAAYKSLYVIRGLIKAGHQVRVIPTQAALKMVGAPTFEALTGHAVNADVFSGSASVEHIQLADWASDIVIVPASANTIAKITYGLADNMLTATVLASRARLSIAPAMHTGMWENPATQANIAILKDRGVQIIGPVSGDLSSGDGGLGRMSEPEEILAQLLDESGDLSGVRVLISAGGTHEPIDPVRFIGNRSSGKQGVALAAAAASRGARVTLVAANIAPQLIPAGITVETVETAQEMHDTMLALAKNADIVIMAAAVADFTPIDPAEHKLGKVDANFVPRIALRQTEDVLAKLVRVKKQSQIVIGFSAETGDEDAALARAKQKAARKGSDLTVFNLVGKGVTFGQDSNRVIVLDLPGNELARVNGSKLEVAHAILDAAKELKISKAESVN